MIFNNICLEEEIVSKLLIEWKYNLGSTICVQEILYLILGK